MGLWIYHYSDYNSLFNLPCVGQTLFGSIVKTEVSSWLDRHCHNYHLLIGSSMQDSGLWLPLQWCGQLSEELLEHHGLHSPGLLLHMLISIGRDVQVHKGAANTAIGQTYQQKWWVEGGGPRVLARDTEHNGDDPNYGTVVYHLWDCISELIPWPSLLLYQGNLKYWLSCFKMGLSKLWRSLDQSHFQFWQYVECFGDALHYVNDSRLVRDDDPYYHLDWARLHSGRILT